MAATTSQPSFPFRESPVNILCPCLGIYVTAAVPGPPEMAVAPGVGSPVPAPPLLYKWGGRGLGEPGCALKRRGAAARSQSQRARALRPLDPFSGGERREPGARAPGSARRGESRLPASQPFARPPAQRPRPRSPAAATAPCSTLASFLAPTRFCSRPPTRAVARNPAPNCPGCPSGTRPLATQEVRSAAGGAQTAAQCGGARCLRQAGMGMQEVWG